MPVSADPSPSGLPRRRLPLLVPVASLAVLGAAGYGAVIAAAGSAAGPRVLVTIVAFGLCAWAATVAAALAVHTRRESLSAAVSEIGALQQQISHHAAQTAHLVKVAVPAVAKRLRDGASAEEALADAHVLDDLDLGRILRSFAAEVAAFGQERAAAQADLESTARRASRVADELDRLTDTVLPVAFDRLHGGASADTVLAELSPPADERVRVLLRYVVREFATSERRSAAARAAGAKALSRVQAKAVSMLAELRAMQERHGEEVLGDLLRLDHSTSQLGLLADRLALLIGGRASRAWNKPIVMESILRGAVGRIAAYQRVRMHCSSTAAVAGFAAEGVMHLLAELIDNAANFSPPVDEVNVYVEERSAGIVVVVEDSGLRMADATMRRAEKAVSGQSIDLATLQGTRLGLAVVGRLAVKYDIAVSYRPSSRGGTGALVFLPPQLLAQQRTTPATPAPVPPARAPQEVLASTASVAADDHTSDETANGLPVRPRGHTMARAERDREQARDTPAQARRPGRDAGTRFGAYHRSRHSDGPSG